MKFIKENFSAILFTVLVHVVVLSLFAINIDFDRKTVKSGERVAVKAQVINSAALDAEVKRQEKIEQDKLNLEMQRQKDLEDKVQQAKKQREAEEKRLATLEKQRKQKEIEAKKQAALDKKRKLDAEKKRKAKEAENRKKEDAEKKRLTEIEAKRKSEEAKLEQIKKDKAAADAKRLAEAKAEAEAKKKAEDEAKKKAMELAAKKKAEEEAKVKAAAAEAKRIAELEAELAGQIANEEAYAQAVGSGELAKYVKVLSQHIERNWRAPPSVASGLKCVLNVRQIPGGDVASLSFGKCNADEVVRDSIEQAVFRASPLPSPEEGILFTPDLEIIFEPGI